MEIWGIKNVMRIVSTFLYFQANKNFQSENRQQNNTYDTQMK